MARHANSVLAGLVPLRARCASFLCVLCVETRGPLQSPLTRASRFLLCLMFLCVGASSPAKALLQNQPAAASDPEAELQTGISLTRAGNFGAAIPHFLAARGHVKDAYAAEFNLALCYVGTSQFS